MTIRILTDGNPSWVDLATLATLAALAGVATSGAYADLTGKPVRAGTVVATLLDTALAVTFSSAFPDNAYQVFLQPQSSVSITYFPSVLTASGFTLNLSAGVNATFSYLAVRA